MKKLEPQAQYWFDASMAWTEKFWDGDKKLCRSPSYPGHHDVRNSIWYALGLLQNGDAERAEAIIRAVISYQYNIPEKVYHGTFKRAPLEPDPVEPPSEWRGYDPNWREFICTVFLVMLKDFDLPENLQQTMWSSIRLAAEGAYTRNVEAAYTNIALMSALLLDHAGRHFEVQVWRERAESLAHEIYALFKPYQTFWEYNSPTYYGTDLYALCLWVEYGLTDTFKQLGLEMEAGLWRDIARFYHAGLRNLCGPYDRSYGMDMTAYQALVGLYIALLVPVESAPLPDPAKDFGHADDFMFGPLVSYTGTRVPDEVLPDLLAFQGERQLERSIEPGRVATAFLAERLMLGAETPHPTRLPNEQFHAATAHWRLPEGGIGWLRVMSTQPFSARATKQRLLLSCKQPQTLSFQCNVPVTQTMLTSKCWTLPGLLIEHQLEDANISLESASALKLELASGDWYFDLTGV